MIDRLIFIAMVIGLGIAASLTPPPADLQTESATITAKAAGVQTSLMKVTLLL